MKFAVQLKGVAHVLEAVTNCFQGNSARIRKIGDGWFLESSAFDACVTEDEVVLIAEKILVSIHHVCVLHAQLYSPFEIGSVHTFTDAGTRVSRTVRGSIKIAIYASKGLQDLQNPRGEESMGSAVVGVAMKEERVREALALLGDLEWPQLYNILEFLGGTNAIVRRKWATRKQTQNCKQTANHHRHLGKPTKNRLPANPPSLSEARILVLDLLKRWMSEQL